MKTSALSLLIFISVNGMAEPVKSVTFDGFNIAPIIGNKVECNNTADTITNINDVKIPMYLGVINDCYKGMYKYDNNNVSGMIDIKIEIPKNIHTVGSEQFNAYKNLNNTTTYSTYFN